MGMMPEAARRNAGMHRQPFRLLPVVVASALAFGIPYLAEHLVLAAGSGWSSAIPRDDRQLLAYLFFQHGTQALLSLLAMACIQRFIKADFGMRWPSKLGPIAWAGLLSSAIFAAFTLVAYLPNLVTHQRPPIPHPLNPISILGWSLFQGGFVGPTEEVLFRSLLVGYLAAELPGFIRLRWVNLSWATALAALLFGLAHLPGNLDAPWWQNAFRVTYSFVLGMGYGYWFERSRSLVVPSIAHNITDLAALFVGFELSANWP